jgi:hypothetical protein
MRPRRVAGAGTAAEFLGTAHPSPGKTATPGHSDAGWGDPVTARDLERIHLGRLNAEYQPLPELCRLLRTGASLDFRAGRITQLAFAFDMGQLVEEFLRSHHREVELESGHNLVEVEQKHCLGRLHGEFRMQVDLRLTDDTGRRIPLDTKYKVLDPGERHGALSQADFYQMFGYGRAGKEAYDEIILLFPETGGVSKCFLSGEMRLRVRSFDPRSIWDPASGRIEAAGACEALRRALSVQREHGGFGEGDVYAQSLDLVADRVRPPNAEPASSVLAVLPASF